jgi:hypothetical protein
MTNPTPAKVVFATRLMWIFWAAGVVYTGTGLYRAVQLALPGIGRLAIAYAVVLGLLALLIYSVSRGRNWARITYSVFVAIASLFIVASLVTSAGEMSLVRTLVAALLVVGYGVIVWLLFQPESAAWFRKGRASAA